MGEKGVGVVVLGGWVVGGENSEDFAAHASVTPELAAVLEGSPDGGAGGDGVDAAEDGFAGGVFGAPAVGDGGDGDRGIDLVDLGCGGLDFELAEVTLQVALGGDVGRLDSVEVDQLDVAGTDGGELESDLAANGSDADDGDRE